ncbi:MAG TPA: hypothetical protein VIK18_03150 [Pirellulales bacterium]
MLGGVALAGQVRLEVFDVLGERPAAMILESIRNAGLLPLGSDSQFVKHGQGRGLVLAQRHAPLKSIGVSEAAIPLGRLLDFLSGSGRVLGHAAAGGVNVAHALRFEQTGHNGNPFCNTPQRPGSGCSPSAGHRGKGIETHTSLQPVGGPPRR